MHTFVRGIGLLALGLLFAGPVTRLPAAARLEPRQSTPGPGELKKLHVLMAFDTEDEDLAPSLRIDELRMRRLLRQTIPEARYSVTVLKGKEVTPDRILGYYRELKVDANDGLLFFYGGHGALDPEKKHFFNLACDKKLYRADLRKTMEELKTVLVVVLSDCCSTPAKVATVAPRKVEMGNPVRAIHPTVRCLLFQSRGSVDVTAATDNASWSDDEKGGLFTRSICRMMTTSVKALDKNKDGFVSWQEFFPQLQKETEIVFGGWSRELRARGAKIEAGTQKPHSYALGNAPTQTDRDYAVVTIENGTGEVLTYRWRWLGGQEWIDVKLAKGEKKVHYLALTAAQQTLPLLEAEIMGRGTGKLRPGKWTGKGEPMAEDGESYRIRPRKK